MIVSNTTDIKVKCGMKVKDIIEELSKLPPDADFDVYQTKYYDQRDSGTKGITVSWKEVR